MKTMKKMLVLVIMLTIATGYANESCTNVSTKAVTFLKFLNVKKGHQYTIKDDQGSILYTETIKRNGTFLKKFYFTDLDDGLYTFEIMKDFEIIIKPFKIESKTVLFLEDLARKEFKPVVRLENDKLLISQLSFDENPLEVKVYFEEELIYSDQIEGSIVLESTYRLLKNVKGSYSVSLKSGDRYFYENFEL